MQSSYFWNIVLFLFFSDYKWFELLTHNTGTEHDSKYFFFSKFSSLSLSHFFSAWVLFRKNCKKQAGFISLKKSAALKSFVYFPFLQSVNMYVCRFIIGYFKFNVMMTFEVSQPSFQYHEFCDFLFFKKRYGEICFTYSDRKILNSHLAKICFKQGCLCSHFQFSFWKFHTCRNVLLLQKWLERLTRLLIGSDLLYTI